MKQDLKESERAARDAVEYVADVIVVGAGGAGLAAAIEAANLGRTVILLEKNPEIGGSTIRAIGRTEKLSTLPAGIEPAQLSNICRISAPASI